jgi:hypothetical protein
VGADEPPIGGSGCWALSMTSVPYHLPPPHPCTLALLLFPLQATNNVMQAKAALAEAEDIENLRAVRLSKSMHTDVVLMAEVRDFHRAPPWAATEQPSPFKYSESVGVGRG